MKKWTYLVASLLLAGTTPLLTGCVDTDEPSGIEELRGAKAELLKAKAAVEAAKVATVQAEAAYKNAEAEYKKAEAALVLAKAAYWEAKTENEKAAAQQALNAAIEEANRAAALWEVQFKKLQQEYLKAIAETLKANDAYLSSYRGALSEAKIDLDKAADALVKAQRDYEDALAVIDDNEVNKELMTRTLQKDVVAKQRALAGAQAAYEEAKAAYAEAQSMELDDLAVRYEELQAKVDAMSKELAAVKAADAEAVYQLEITEGVEVKKDFDALVEMKNEEVVLPAISIEFKGGLPGGQQGTIDAEEAEYSYNNQSAYGIRKNQLEYYLGLVNSWVRDENDNEWTKEGIAKLQAELDDMLEDHEATLTLWKEAVAAFHTNEYPTTDPTKITGYEDLKSAVDAYNAAAKAYNELEAKRTAADAAKAAAFKTAIEKLGADLTADTDGSIKKAYDEAIEAAEKAKKAAMDGAAEEAKKQYKALQDSEAAAKKALDKATADLAKDPTNTDLQTAKALAQLIYNDAKAALDATSEAALKTKIESDATLAYTTAINEAKKKKTADKNAALKDYNDVTTAQNKVLTSLGAYYTNGTELNKAYSAAKVAAGKVDKAFEVFKENASYTNTWSKNFTYQICVPVWDAEKDLRSVATVTIEKVAGLSKEGLFGAIKDLSTTLFGTSMYASNAYGDPDARLIEFTSEQVQEIAEKQLAASSNPSVGQNGYISSNLVSLTNYINIYNGFGYVGQEIALEQQIEMLKSYLDNSADVDALIAAIQEEYDATVEAYEAMVEKVEAADQAYQERNTAYIASKQEAIQPETDLISEQQPLRTLCLKYQQIISGLMNADPKNNANYGSEALEQYISACARAVDTQEGLVYDAETNLMLAEKNLADWNNGAINHAEYAKRQLEDAQTKYNRAEEAYQAALDALNAAIAYLASFE